MMIPVKEPLRYEHSKFVVVFVPVHKDHGLCMSCEALENRNGFVAIECNWK